MNRMHALALLASAAAAACGGAARAQPAGALIDELVVTAQKREQSVQDVPAAISSFGQQELQARGVAGVDNLVIAVPNLTYTRRNLRTNFQIRGVGSQLTSFTGDDGVGIHQNFVPLTSNRNLGDAEFYDVQRVEVLRGPQGTLFGRNATGGVVNVITNMPTHEFAASIAYERGNYESNKLQGFVNVPLGEVLAVRLAGFGLDRDGYTTNLLTGDDLDSRSILAGRATLSFEPSDRFRALVQADFFTENDTRGARKQLCAKDPGLTAVRGVATGVAQAAFTQGCLNVSVYDDSSYGTTNTLSTIAGILARQIGLQPVDSFTGRTVPRDLRAVQLTGKPQYKPRSELYQLDLQWRPTDTLTLNWLSAYNENENFTRGDSLGTVPTVPFPVSAVAPAGTLNDPQLGMRDRLATETIYDGDNEQWSHEARLRSEFDGPLNFSVGAIYLRNKLLNYTYVASNAFTAFVRARVPTAYVDPLLDPDYTGHNYFVSITRYKLKSKAAFGEVYWNPTDDLRVTLGLRYTDDDKWTQGSGSTFLQPGTGPIFAAAQKIRFKETTGRLNVDWSPDLTFTDDTLLYATFSRGYKAGGFNPARVVELGLPDSYDPEFVNAVEVGAKNTLAGGALVLNLTAFAYDYEGYQIVRNVNRSIFNENVDAKIKGVEFDGRWAATEHLQFSASIGYLDSKITDGTTVDTYDRLQGDSTYVRGSSTAGGCIVNAQGLAAVLALPQGPGVLLDNVCAGPATLTTRLTAAGVAAAAASTLSAGVYSYGPNVSRFSNGAGEGVIQNLAGNELPNAPQWTVSLGAQYTWQLGPWNARLRADYYRQSHSVMRYNDAAFDRIKAWDNVNASLTFVRPDYDLEVQFFVKNLMDENRIVGFDIADENLGSYRTALLLDPRLYGVSIRKGF